MSSFQRLGRPSSNHIGEITSGLSLNGVQGTVTEQFGSPDLSMGPLPLHKYEYVFAVRIAFKNFLIDVYFYDIWAKKCNFLAEGDNLLISGPSTMVYSSKQSIATAAETTSIHKMIIRPYCICIDKSIQESAFRVSYISSCLSP